MRNRPEDEFRDQLLLDFGAVPSLMIWKNLTGRARSLANPDVIFPFGCIGSPDILGVKAVTITPDMVGKTFGLAVGIETKDPGKGRGTHRESQKNFQASWVERGGLYILAKTREQVERGLGLNG